MIRPSLRDIAEAAGVSEMTVSRVLRSHRLVSPKTRATVLRIAGELGYRPDPQLAKMMAYMRSSRISRKKEKLAFIWLDAKPGEIETNPYLQRMLNGMRPRAETLGFGIDEFFLAESGLSLARLSRILDTRGIGGVLVSPLLHHVSYELVLRWEHFSTVVIGRGQVGPALHRVGPDHYQGMACAMKALRNRGHMRIGLCVSGVSLQRQDHRWEGAFVMHHPLGLHEASPLMLVKEFITREELARWLATRRPDAVLFHGNDIADYRDAEKPHKASQPVYACLDWLPGLGKRGFPGIEQHYEIIGANAVDLVTAHLLRNERGVPPQPKTVLSEGTWRDATDGGRAP